MARRDEKLRKDNAAPGQAGSSRQLSGGKGEKQKTRAGQERDNLDDENIGRQGGLSDDGRKTPRKGERMPRKK